ncbi:hypothetical protein NBRC111894_4381 [Sporolactobacillus inulinus]|uniref:Uncharacterized protein n=1 Tax=Sporolactobacillus inulinus TaxID=2078 RepID=A0A4Y1ZI60_9BACL|nr:hypothetical protein NBRC111894_4381 [Sporolactobacillus inulinus]
MVVNFPQIAVNCFLRSLTRSIHKKSALRGKMLHRNTVL